MSAEAFVLAAGLGTRLRPFTLARPKPLMPVCGVPMLAYALALLRRHGFDRAIVNAHHLADQLAAWEGDHEGVRVTISTELPDILGTGGGLRAVRSQLAGRFVVLNADVLCDVDLRALVAAVPDGGGAMALRPHAEDAARYGVVAADAEGVVVALSHIASAPAVGDVARDTHFTGVHALDLAALEQVPDGFACIVRTAYRALVPQRRVRGVRHAGTWIDIGDPAAWHAANLAVLTTPLPLPLDPTPRAAYARGPRGAHGGAPVGVTVEGAVWIGPGATVAPGAVLRDCVIGPGALVRGDARLSRCVVWDGVEVGGEVTDAIVWPGGVVGVGA